MNTNVEAEMDGEPIPTKKGFYYVSKTRKHGKNPLWVGPFNSTELCYVDAAKYIEEKK